MLENSRIKLFLKLGYRSIPFSLTDILGFLEFELISGVADRRLEQLAELEGLQERAGLGFPLLRKMNAVLIP